MATVLRTWTGVLVVGGALGAGATQCALMPSLDGFSGSQGVPDASPADAAGEGGGDGGTEGGDSGRWCASLSPAPLFCDDFDDQGPFTRWTDQYVRSGGTVARDGTAFRSAPNALLTLSPSSIDPSSAFVYLSTADTKSKVHVAYDMRIDSRDPTTGYAEVNELRFDTPGLAFAIYLRVFNDPNTSTTVVSEAYLPDGGVPSHEVALAGNPRFDGWRRVGVDIDLASTPHTVAVTLDGKAAGTVTLEPSLYAPGPVRMQLGIAYTGHPTTSTWAIRYDDVTIDWQ